jgi:hypothetical protein
VQGAVNGAVNVSARLVLCRYNLADLHPDRAATDVIVRSEMRKLFSLLYQPATAETKAHTNGARMPLASKL